jgi:hypothetical protein
MAFKFSVISNNATFSLASTPVATNEGAVAVLQLDTTGVQNGQTIPYTITGTGITSADISGASLTGNFTVQNNTAQVPLTIAADATTEGLETLTLTLNDYNTVHSSMNINDTSITPTFALQSNPTTTNEGTSSVITLNTTGVANGTVVPYTISGTGITSADISGASLTGNFTIASGNATLTLNIANDVTTEGFETLTLTLDGKAVSVTLGINDTSTSDVVDPYWSNVTAALLMDGTNSSTTFIDAKGHTVTSSSAIISTAQSKFGGAGGYFSGSSNLTIPASTDFDFGAGDFTLETWIYPTTNSINGTLFDRWHPGVAGSCSYRFYRTTTGAISGVYNASVGMTASALTTPLNQWSHVAFVRTAGVVSYFINGVKDSVTNTVGTLNTPDNPLYIGNATEGGAAFAGYMDDLRITKGIGRYTTTFTPVSFANTIPTYTLTSNPTPSANEGTSVVITLTTTSITNGQTIPYTISGANITSADISGASLTGNFTVNNNTATLTLNIAADLTSEGAETLTLSVNINNNTNAAVSLTINDTSTTAFDAYNKLSTVIKASNTNAATNNTFVDTSTISPLTRNGNPTQGSFSPFSNNGFSSVFASTGVITMPYVNTPIPDAGITDGSMYFNGVGDYLSIPAGSQWAMGTGDFTAEAWVNPSVLLSTYQGLFGDIFWQNGYQGGWYLAIGASGNIIMTYNGTNASWSELSSAASAVAVNVWTHIAVTCVSGTLHLYINGVQVGQVAKTRSYTGAYTFRVGAYFADQIIGYFNGYLADVRVVKGTAVYTGNFTPPIAPLAPITNTSVMLKGTTSGFVDTSTINGVITKVGIPSVQTMTPFVRPPMDWWTADYTLEAWIYPTAHSGFDAGTGYQKSVLIGNRDKSSTTDYWSFGNNLNGQVVFYYWNGATNQVVTSSTVSLNVWSHIAMTLSGSTINLFINGVLSATGTVAGTPVSSNAYPLTIGAGNNAYYNGSVSNLRIVKGTALYTTNFTPSTSKLTSTANTKLLTLNSSVVSDASASGRLITSSGATYTQQFSPFAPTVYLPSVNSGSVYLDGVGDFLSVPAGTQWTMGTGDFTAEAWINPASVSTAQTLFGDFNWSSGYQGGWMVGIAATGAVGFTYNGASAISSAASAIKAGTWQHIAISCTSGAIRLFVNGVLAASGTKTQTYSGAFVFRVGAYIADGALYNYYTGHISNLRVVKGTSLYTTNFTPSLVPLTSITGTSLLLSGSNAGIYDANGVLDYETIGNTTVSTSVVKFSSSVHMDGAAGSYLSSANLSPVTFGTGEFTIEGWFNVVVGGGTYPRILDWQIPNASSTGPYPVLNIDPTGRISYNVGFTNVIDSGAGVISSNTWTHIAVSRAAGQTRLFVNGVQRGATYTDAANYSAGANNIGRHYQGNGGFNGYVEDFRVTKGVGRYVTTFTPQASTF